MNDKAIIAGICRREEAAIAAAMDKYSRLLWAVAVRTMGDAATEQDAEECVADVFVKLWQEPEKFDPGRGSLKAWLTIMTRSRCVDCCRRLMRQSALPLAEEVIAASGDPAESAEALERRQALAQAVESLSPRSREILRRRYGENQMPRQIAREMALPIKQVENRLYRAKQKLRDRLEEG